MCTSECVLSDASVSTSATGTNEAPDRSGWMMSRVLVVKQPLHSVDIEDGEFTTVVTARTSQYRVLHRGRSQVRNFTVRCRCVLRLIGCDSAYGSAVNKDVTLPYVTLDDIRFLLSFPQDWCTYNISEKGVA